MIHGFSLKRFCLKTLLFMPLCFVLWYFTATIWTWPIAVCADSLLRWFFPQLIAGIEHQGTVLNVVTNLGDMQLFTQQQKMAALVFNINPLTYGYSLALFSAILLASPSDIQHPKYRTWLGGILVLLGGIVFGVCVDALKSIAFDLAPVGMTYPTGFSEWQLNLLGASYQLGYLILPTVVPLLLWVNANKQFFHPLSVAVK